MTAWYDDDAFWVTLGPHLFRPAEWAAAPAQVDALARLIAVELARRGMVTTGVDRTQAHLDEASRQAAQAGVALELVRADRRFVTVRPSRPGARGRRTHVTIPRLLLVTDRHATDGRDLVDVVERALGAGLPAVQLRDKDLDGRPLFGLAERLRAATRRAGALFFVNDRVDVAVAVGADGVQLGVGALPVAVARSVLRAGFLIGQSTHALDEVSATVADFVLFGPVFATPSKRAYGAPHDVASLARVAAAARVPVLAIGGVDATNVASVRAAGVHGVAVIRAILGAADPAIATRTLLADAH